MPSINLQVSKRSMYLVHWVWIVGMTGGVIKASDIACFARNDGRRGIYGGDGAIVDSSSSVESKRGSALP